MKLLAPGQLRRSSEEDGELNSVLMPHRQRSETYLVLGPTEKPGVWFVVRESGEIESWWQDGLEDDPVLSEAE